MKKVITLALLIVVGTIFTTSAQAADKNWAVVVNTNNHEIAWNALRVARFALRQGNDVSVFFLGSGVQAAAVDDKQFNVAEVLADFVHQGGEVHACKACLRIHNVSPGEACPAGTLPILYEMIDEADKVLIF